MSGGVGRGIPPRAGTDIDSLNVDPGSPRSPPNLSSELEQKPLQSESKTSEGNSTRSSSEIVKEKDDGPAERDNGSRQSEPTPPVTRFTLDPQGEQTHDETTVDIVTVPCPGGHPLRSWNRDGLLSRYFGAPAMRDAEVGNGSSDKPLPSWVRQGIRRESDRARILLYEHPMVEDGTTLGTLADELLQELQRLRTKEGANRPLIFIGHSIGGLVVKMALAQAAKNADYQGIMRECYGVVFFGTPHQGSSYFAMPSLASSIQSLLQLSTPLPTSITDDLRVGNSVLLHLDDDFKDVSNDLKVWTFYETIDSRLSGSASGDVYFTAPLASIKSAILGLRQERIFPLQSDHANIASFGRHNIHTLGLFLKQLSIQISRADENVCDEGCRWTLNLEQKVNIEVHGFFEDPVGPDTMETTLRAWSTRLPLKDFLRKGPEQCLTERLNEVEGLPEESRFLRKRGRTTRMDDKDENEKGEHNQDGIGMVEQEIVVLPNPLGIRGQPPYHFTPPTSPIIRGFDTPGTHRRTESAPPGSPNFAKGSIPVSPPTRFSTPMRNASPLMRADFEQDLAVDRLSPALRPRVGRSASRSFSEGSRLEYKDFPPFSQRSRSSVGSPKAIVGVDDDINDIDSVPPLPESIVAIRKVVKDNKNQVSETVIVDELPVAFIKPEMKSRKFMWIHLPFNNPTWVKNVLETLGTSNQRNYSPLYSHDFWQTKHTKGRHSQHYAYFAKPGCYFTAPRNMTPHRRSIGTSSPLPRSIEEGMYTCLFLPYLHFDSYKRLLRRRELIIKRLQHGRAHPVPDSVAKADSVELQVIWEFLGHDPPLNCRRTLDQFGYPSLRDTRGRDDDQMLYKLTKERVSPYGEKRDVYMHGESSRAGSDGSSNWHNQAVGRLPDAADEEAEEEVLNGNVLVVDQLWLWVLNNHTILSFFPKRESDPIEGPLYQQADLRDSIFNEVNVDLTRQCDNALDMAALTALHAVCVLLERSSHPDLEVFRIFEEAISVLTEKLTLSLKTFRAEGFRDKAFEHEPDENKAGPIRARHKEEGRRAEAENRDNTSALLELRDIEDELIILLHLFERQSKVISAMHAIYTRPELRDITTNGRSFLNEALKKLSEYIHQTNEMIRRVRNTRDDYDKLLQMVQRQAQVDEVRLSRLHADLASAQSRSVMIFTTFTVIFLPLTFFTGLFGMNTREWTGDTYPRLKTIGMIALPSSFVMVAASLFIAWSTTVRRFFRWTSHAYTHIANFVRDFVIHPTNKVVGKGYEMVAAKLRKRRTRREYENDSNGADASGNGNSGGKGRTKGGVNREPSDFWERHRLERERGYRVPEVNKNIGNARMRSGRKDRKA